MSRCLVLIVIEMLLRSIWCIPGIEVFQISTYGIEGIRLGIV